MVNYRRVVCEVALLAVLAAVVTAAPAPDCAMKHYDQRQNGSENYRLNIDGVVIAVAPAESLLSALGDMDDLLDLAMEEYNTDYKPKPPSEGSPSPSPAIQVISLPVPEPKPQDDKEKPAEDKPMEEKPQVMKPEEPAKPAEPASPLSDVSMGNEMKIQKKDASLRKQEKAQRLKHRLASFLMPLLRKTRHH
ncbi:hypothetical protein PYW07_003681 [Mythimna separata]|uniref:Uncharacterized protein n=1 Tax=Mythimna separata TaxID=271217 RepID=A0AAD7YN92_MYTSE|nr:hypothetical protein PYW07_003681 [Mythimna separata]